MITGFRLLLALCLLAALVCPATAQTERPTPSRPFRGLFGGAQPMSSRSQSLDLSASVFGGWDQPLDQQELAGTTPGDRAAVSGPYSGGSATVTYNHPGDKVTFNAFGSLFGGYFPDNKPDPWYTSSAAGANLSSGFSLSPRTTLHVGAQTSFATDISLGTLGGAGIPPSASGGTGFDGSFNRDPSLDSNGTVTLAHELSDVSTLSAGVSGRYSHFFSSDTERSDTVDSQAIVTYSRSMTKNAALHLGYSYGRFWAITPDDTRKPSTFQNIDAGVNYSKALSISRNTTLSFSTGSTIASSVSGGSNGQSGFSNPHFYLTGSANLARQIGRSWQANANYSRSVTYQLGFDQPVLLDTASASIGGLIGSRTDVSSVINYNTGAVGLATYNYHAWLSTSQLRVAITRTLAAYVSHYYDDYTFAQDVTIPGGVPRSLKRNGVRAGLTAWLPLWHSRGIP